MTEVEVLMPDPAQSCLIGGAWEPGAGGSLASTSPYSGEVVWLTSSGSTTQADRAMEAASSAFAGWHATSRADRVQIARAFADLVADERDQLAELIALETGKVRWDAVSELVVFGGKVEASVAALEDRTGTRRTEQGPATVTTWYRAQGPMVVVGPFNFPALLPNSHIIPALLAGNTVVFKPSEHAPATGAAIAQLWHRAGLPPGVLNLVHGGPDIVTRLVDHPDTRGVLFTGGVHAGRSILRRLVERPDVVVALELGGNNPLVVWDVAEVSTAARLVVHSAFVSAGQRCLCARRLVLPEGRRGDEVLDAVVELVDRLRIGDPLGDPQPFYGPLIDGRAVERVVAAQADLVSRGAAVVRSATGIPGLGPACLRPGVLEVDDVVDRPDEEIFGPVLQVIRVPDLDAAIREANATRFGLAAAIVSDDADAVDAFLQRSTAGMAHANVPTVAASGLAPFGGTGWSGNHRPSGYHAADTCAMPIATITRPAPADPGPIQGVDD